VKLLIQVIQVIQVIQLMKKSAKNALALLLMRLNALAKAQQASDGAQAEVLDDIAEEVFEQETEDSLQDIVTTPANDKIEVGANLDDMLQETDDIAITEADVDETDDASVDYDDYMVQYNQFDKFDEIDVSQIQDAEAKPKKSVAVAVL
jgi:hypothetical protein